MRKKNKRNDKSLSIRGVWKFRLEAARKRRFSCFSLWLNTGSGFLSRS